jgi:hypothetical protein
MEMEQTKALRQPDTEMMIAGGPLKALTALGSFSISTI